MSVETPQRALTSQPHGDSFSGAAVISPPENLMSIEKQGETLVYALENVSDASTSLSTEAYFQQEYPPSCLNWGLCCWSSVISCIPGGIIGFLTGGFVAGTDSCVTGIVAGGIPGMCIGGLAGPAVISVSCGGLVTLYKICNHKGKPQVLRLTPEEFTDIQNNVQLED